MLEYIREFFQIAPYAAWSILSVLVILIFVAYAWDHVKWWWLNTWMSFPFIGVIATTSKDFNRTQDDKWFVSESNLCNAYSKFIGVIDATDYKEKKSYLVLSGDNGRTPMPGLLWFGIIVMVFIEAMGFSYVLAGFTIPGASENVQQVGAYGIAILVSAILIFVTHAIGHELYVNSLRINCRAMWQNDTRSWNTDNANDNAGTKPELRTGTVALSEPQDKDKSQKEYTRVMNRIGMKTEPGYQRTIWGAIFIIVIAIGATYVRGQVLEKMLGEEVVGRTEQVNITSDALDMSIEIKLPSADKAQDQIAQDDANNKSVDNERHGGWATFIVLAFIFLGLQMLSIYFGFKWTFAGENSSDAYRAVGKYPTYSDVLERYNYVRNIAQSKLSNLQQRMLERNSQVGTSFISASKNTFDDFLSQQRIEKAKHDEIRLTHDLSNVKDNSSNGFDAKAIALKVNSLINKDDKLKFLGEAKLTDSQQNEVAQILKSLKKESDESNKLSGELDGLL